LRNISYKSKFLVFLILTIGYLAMGASRLVLGVHSLNQVFYGFALGLWSLIFVMWFL
jgi:membrane-associated phospholipid phosphatase